MTGRVPIYLVGNDKLDMKISGITHILLLKERKKKFRKK